MRQGQGGRPDRHGGGMPEHGDRLSVAGEIPVADDGHQAAGPEPAAHRPSGGGEGHDVDGAARPALGEELEQRSRTDLLDRRHGAQAARGEEGGEGLEAAEVPADENARLADDPRREHIVPVDDLDHLVDPRPVVARRAQELEVVAGVAAERVAHHAAERRPVDRAAGGGADAGQVGGHQPAAARGEASPAIAGQVGDGVGGPGRQGRGQPLGRPEREAQQHQAEIFVQSSPRRAASSAAVACARSASVCGHTGRNMYHWPGSWAITRPRASARACVAR